jgi:PAS domain S-box-containing protein
MWPDWLVWEHVTGNALVWLAYFALPAMIWRLGSGQGVDWTPFKGLIRAFAFFIGLCGLGHFLDMLAFFHPLYRLAGHTLVLTGMVSWWTVWSLCRAWPAFIALKSPAELERIVADRTESLSRALEELERAEIARAHLATIVESSHDAIVGKDLDGVVTSWNAGAERLFGYTAAEAMGRPITFLMPPELEFEESAILERLRRGESVDHFETRRLTKGGRLIDVSLAISPIKDRFGQIIGISKIARDISASKRSAELIRQSEEKFRQLANSIPQLTWMARSDGHVVWFNQRWYDYTGTTPEQVEGWGWQSVHHPEVLPRVLDRWHAGIASGDPIEMVYPLRGVDGQFRNFLTRAIPLVDASGRVVSWFGTSTDIDEQTRAEERIKASERIYRAIGESIPFGVWICGPEGRSRYASDSFLRLVGQTQTECSDFGWANVVHPDDLDRTMAAWHECVRNEATWDNEIRFRGTDGQWHPVLARGVPVRDDSGQITCWAGINLDIGRMKRTEEALRASEERQRLAMATARIAHWEWDPVVDRVTYQSSLSRLYDRPDDRPFADLSDYLAIVHPDDRRLVLAAVEKAVAPGGRYEVDYRIVLTDGTIRWLSGRGGTIFRDDGTPLRMLGINVDITQNKESETQIRLLNESLEQRVRERTAELAQQVRLINMARDAIMVRSIGGLILLWNEGAERLYGWKREEAIGKRSHDLLETRFPMPLEEIEEVLKRHGSWDGELIHKSREGATIVVASRWVLDRDRSVDAAILEINTDITERRAYEETLRRARDEAMAATTAKGEFLANMSHEIRTPMNGVVGMTELLMDTELNDLQRHYAETIRSSGEALLTVINDILDFSKIEAGKMELESTEFEPRSLVEEVVDLLGPRAQQKGLSIASRVDVGVPRWLSGDAVRIRQVLTNLVGNAVKFTESGSVELEARFVARDQAKGTLRIDVRDTGIGIAEDRQADIFESFTQIEGGNRRRYGGTGLGLAICRRLIALMDGRLGLESRPGAGSKFWFELELEKTRDDEHLPPTEYDALHHAPGSDATFARGDAIEAVIATRPVVLLAEDNEINRRVAIGLLERLGCEVEAVSNGRAAVEAVDYTRHNIVLMDVQMPEMDGFQATAIIRERERMTGQHIAIVALTARAMRGDQERCLTAGMDAYISKPLNARALRDTLISLAGVTGKVPGGAAKDRSPVTRSWFPEAIQESCGYDLALVSEVIRSVLRDIPTRLERLESAIERRDGRQASWEAHSLKGAFLTIGAHAMASACDEVRNSSESSSFSSMESTFFHIRNHWNDFQREAIGYLESSLVATSGDS